MSHFVNSGSKWIQVVDRQLKNDSSSPSTSKRIGSSVQLPRGDQPPHVCHYATAILAAFEQIYPFDGCSLFPSVSAIGPSSKWANHTAIITKWANHPGLFWPGLKETGQAIHSPATGSTTAEDIAKGMEGGSLLSRWRERAEREQCLCVKCSAPFRGIAGGSMYVTVSTLRAVWSGFFVNSLTLIICVHFMPLCGLLLLCLCLSALMIFATLLFLEQNTRFTDPD